MFAVTTFRADGFFIPEGHHFKYLPAARELAVKPFSIDRWHGEGGVHGTGALEPSRAQVVRGTTPSSGWKGSRGAYVRNENFHAQTHAREEIQYLSIGMIDIQELKRFAIGNLLRTSRLRAVLLSERDQLTAMDFLAKMDTWIKLLNIEFSK